MIDRKFRGSTESPDLSNLPPPWEKLDSAEKIKRSIDLMSDPKYIRKRGRASGEDALMLRIGREEGLTREIATAPHGREAIVSFIENLFRSEDSGHSYHAAGRARKLFALEETEEERAKIRDAELDCRAFAIGSIGLSSPLIKMKEEWLGDLTDDERVEVEHRAKHYEEKIARENKKYE